MREIQATFHAFAAVLTDGCVLTWGDPEDGGDCSTAKDQLRHVQHVRATYHAFAAILSDESVVTFGDSNYMVETAATSMSS